MTFITGFNRQYQGVERIVRKYWPILKSDRILSKILPKRTRFVYRKAPTLRNHLVHNIIDPPKNVKLFSNMKGFYRWQKCLPSRLSKKQPRKRESFRSGVTNKEYQIRGSSTCNSTHVTYIIDCPYQLQYVGRTTRPLSIRIREHINDIRKGFPKHSLSRHFKEVHQKRSKGTHILWDRPN